MLECRPVNVHVYISSKCNMDCTYCWNQRGAFGQEHSGDMSLDTASLVIDFFRKKILTQSSPFYSITLFGGEPMLNPRTLNYFIEELTSLRKETSKDIRILIFTNVYVMDDTTIAMSGGNRFIEYHVGFDGPQENHDKFRVVSSGGGTYKKVAENITRLIEQDVLVVAETLITSPYDYIGLMDEYEKLGIRYAYIQEEVIPVHGNGSAKGGAAPTSPDNDLWHEQYSKFTDYYFKMLCNKTAPLIDPLFGRIKWFLKKEAAGNVACTAGTKQISISCDGNIYSCNQLQGIPGFKIGSLPMGVDDSLLEEYANLLEKEGNMIDNNKECRECPIKTFCKGGCYSKNHVSTGQIGGIEGKHICEFRLIKAAEDWRFIERVMKKFPTYPDDVSARNYADYFPLLYERFG